MARRRHNCRRWSKATRPRRGRLHGQHHFAAGLIDAGEAHSALLDLVDSDRRVILAEQDFAAFQEPLAAERSCRIVATTPLGRVLTSSRFTLRYEPADATTDFATVHRRSPCVRASRWLGGSHAPLWPSGRPARCCGSTAPGSSARVGPIARAGDHPVAARSSTYPHGPAREPLMK